MIKLLVTGVLSQVGSAVCKQAVSVGMEVIALTSADLDLANAQQIDKALSQHCPHYVINTTGYAHVDQAEYEVDLCYSLNRDAIGKLAEVCANHDIPLLHVSSNHVFDGQADHPYTETHVANPINVFGRSKFAGELKVSQYCPKHLILRVSWLFSAEDNNFVSRTLNQVQTQNQVKAVCDQFGCPTPATDIARVLIAMIQQVNCNIEVWGTYHYCGAEVTTWQGFAEAILAAAKKHPATCATAIKAVTSANFPAQAIRPRYSVMDCKKIQSVFGISQRPWRSGLVHVINCLLESRKI